MTRGQSLIEILIGTALGALLVVAAAGLIAPALQTNSGLIQVQAEAQLGGELMDNVKAFAAGNWSGLLSLAAGTGNAYYLNATSSPFAVVASSGYNIESVNVASATYQRYFYVNDVYRDSNGNVTSTVTGNAYDPSTKQVTVVVKAASSTQAPFVYNMYLTRNANNVLNQTSWAGGSGQNGAVTLVGNTYAVAANVAVTPTGSLQLSWQVGGTCLQ